MFYRWSDLDRAFPTYDDLRKQVFHLFNEIDSQQATAGSLPVSVFDSGAALVLAADVPGLTEKDIQVSLTQDVLTIQGERRLAPLEGYTAHRQERSTLKFSRSFALPFKADVERSTAVVKDGVLTLTLARVPEAQPRTIPVNAA